jgi:hypothetical protein
MPPSPLEYRVPPASANSPDGDHASSVLQYPPVNVVSDRAQVAPPSDETHARQFVVATTSAFAFTGFATMDRPGEVGPAVVGVHVAPPSVLFETPLSIAAYTRPGAAGEAASARTCAAEGPSAVQVFRVSALAGATKLARETRATRTVRAARHTDPIESRSAAQHVPRKGYSPT